MPKYDYEIIETGEIVEVTQRITEDKLTKIYSPKLKREAECQRMISPNLCGFQLKGEGWTIKQSGFGKRGYTGKFQNLVREKGTPVNAPANKREADVQFQKYIDSGGLEGIEPTMEFDAKSKPKTAEEMIDKGKFKNG